MQKNVSEKIPRPEYPRPQMVRSQWMNLNGIWEFEIDHSKSGRGRELYQAEQLKSTIVVPFCPESKLSGVEYKDFMAAVWYRREFVIPQEWLSGRVLIHFGAVDYETEIWINGTSAGKHRGGYTSFSFDITKWIQPGVNVVAVCAEDDVRTGLQTGGKQSGKFNSYGCFYTRTTGIWQTVWLESVPENYISSYKVIPDLDNKCVHISTQLEGKANTYSLTAEAFFNGKNMGCKKIKAEGKSSSLTLELSELFPWEPGAPNLYDLKISLYREDECIDQIEGYFGMRSITLKDWAVLLNGKSVFQRLVLDQGFYPEGIYTAPTDEDLKKDIEISMGLGFNGARLHEKVFESRFLYWADKMGYLVWGEHANWGLNITTPMGLERFLPEWLEAVERDFNHPSIIGWCPFNETWDRDGVKQDDEVLRIVYRLTKMLDKTRPVIDTSGNFHVETDIFDIHDYNQDPDTFTQKYEPMKAGGEVPARFPKREKYGGGQPYFVSEYGGIWWNPYDEEGWGYGQRPNSEEEFIERYRGLTEALLKHPMMFGFCYTQLYDVEQEVNGLYTYDRKPKFDPEIFKKINGQKAAIEE